MTIHNVRLRDDIERGAEGGPEFSTFVIEATSGVEARNQNWSTPRRSWNIGYGIINDDDLDEVQAFFINRRGRLFGFLFRDWSDYTLEGEVSPVITGQDYQISKTYTDAGNSLVRPIYRPIASTIEVFDNGVLQTLTTDYTLEDMGVIRFVAAPTGPVTVNGEFDVAVRFDDDKLNIRLTLARQGSIPPIIIKELREPET